MPDIKRKGCLFKQRTQIYGFNPVFFLLDAIRLTDFLLYFIRSVFMKWVVCSIDRTHHKMHCIKRK